MVNKLYIFISVSRKLISIFHGYARAMTDYQVLQKMWSYELWKQNRIKNLNFEHFACIFEFLASLFECSKAYKLWARNFLIKKVFEVGWFFFENKTLSNYFYCHNSPLFQSRDCKKSQSVGLKSQHRSGQGL